jgi:hypothetical protein
MIQWSIKVDNKEFVIETGAVTILKSARWEWFTLIRHIHDFFDSKNSPVEIFEDTQPLYKKDWECLFIPFDAEIELTKMTSKSPLKPLADELIGKLTSSPLFYNLTTLWDELAEELDVLSNNLGEYGLKATFFPLTEDDLKKYLVFQPIKEQMAPFDFKMMLLKLFANKFIDKKRLVILELPELYCNEANIKSLHSVIRKYADKGIKFILVTDINVEGNKNFMIHDKIINQASFETIKRKIINALPFACDDELYVKAVNYTMEAVDNSMNVYHIIEKSFEVSEALAILIYTMFKELGIQISLDKSRFSNNIQSFLDAS